MFRNTEDFERSLSASSVGTSRMTFNQRIGVIVAVILSFVIGLSLGAMAETPLPAHNGARVTDLAGVLSPSDKRRVEDVLARFELSRPDKPQFVVAILKDMPTEGLEDYAIKLFRHWHIGQADQNNGLLWLWVPSARQMRLEVGRGMEGAITDAHASRINREVAGPLLREGKGADAIIAVANRLAKDIDPAPTQTASEPIGDGSFWLLLLTPFLLVGLSGLALMHVRAKAVRDRERRAEEERRRKELLEHRTNDRNMKHQREQALRRAVGDTPRPRPSRPLPPSPPPSKPKAAATSSRLRDEDSSNWAIPIPTSSSWSSSSSSSSDSGSSPSYSGGGGDSAGGGSSDSY